MVRAEFFTQVFELVDFENNAVEIEFLQIRRRWLRNVLAAVRTRTPGMIHARGIVRRERAAMGQHDLEIGEALHDSIEDKIVNGNGGIERVADNVGEVVIAKPIACERGGMNKNCGVQFLRLGPERIETWC